MTSSWFFRQGTLHVSFFNGIWKIDYDFLRASNSNFFSAMHGFHTNEDLLQVGYDVIVISPPRAVHAIFHDEFWKIDNDVLIVYYSNFLSGMHGFRDKEVLLHDIYDVIVISPPWGVSRDFHDGFWKSDLDFLISILSMFFVCDVWFLR